jgi:hypothetical protein
MVFMTVWLTGHQRRRNTRQALPAMSNGLVAERRQPVVERGFEPELRYVEIRLQRVRRLADLRVGVLERRGPHRSYDCWMPTPKGTHRRLDAVRFDLRAGVTCAQRPQLSDKEPLDARVRCGAPGRREASTHTDGKGDPLA